MTLSVLCQETAISSLINTKLISLPASGRADNYKICRDDNHAIDISDIAIMETLEYMHSNTVPAGIVAEGEGYLCSIAMDYAGIKGLVELEII